MLVPGTPKEVEVYVALEDYRDDHNNILLRKEETVVVLDRLSRPGMFKVVRLLADGSKDNEIWVPSTALQRKKSTAEIIMPAGNIWFLDKPRVTNSNLKNSIMFCNYSSMQVFSGIVVNAVQLRTKII